MHTDAVVYVALLMRSVALQITTNQIRGDSSENRAPKSESISLCFATHTVCFAT